MHTGQNAATAPTKSSQDWIGRFLSAWRNRRIARELTTPYLDIACGDNRLVREVAGGVGVDVVDYGAGAEIVERLDRLPFADGGFACVCIVASLNYFDDPRAVLAECARVLRADGRLLVTLIDRGVGSVWHRVREPWARVPGFGRRELEQMAAGLPLLLSRHRRFMLGLNHLYEFTRRP
jgi:SAM-dependent methyltransferase